MTVADLMDPMDPMDPQEARPFDEYVKRGGSLQLGVADTAFFQKMNIFIE